MTALKIMVVILRDRNQKIKVFNISAIIQFSTKELIFASD
jgi:hypothetical protein